MKSIRKRLAHIYTNEQIQKKIEAEKRVTISSVALICLFELVWFNFFMIEFFYINRRLLYLLDTLFNALHL